MSDPDLWTWLAERAGQPIPCDLCRTPIAPQMLRETTMIGAIVTVVPGCEITPRRVLFICPNCPG